MRASESTNIEKDIRVEKKINTYLFRRYFSNHLTLKDQEVLKGKASLDDILSDLLQLNSNDRFKLLICYISSQDYDSIDLPERIVQTFAKDEIAEIACLTGHFNLLQELSFEEDKLKRLLTNKETIASLFSEGGYSIFLKYGNFFISQTYQVKDLWQSVDHYELYKHAAYNGHIEILKHIDSTEGFNANEACKANFYHPYQLAAQNGHLAVLKHLEATEGFNVNIACKARRYYAYRYAAYNGHLAVLKHLEATEGFNVNEACMADDYCAHRLAAQNGHLAVLKHLEATEGFNVNAVCKADNYIAYRLAAQNGHLVVLKYLEATEDFNVNLACKAYHFEVYRLAAQNGHLGLLKHFEATEGFDVNKACKANNYFAFRLAAKNGHLSLLKHLLSQSSVLSYAESHDREYGRHHIYSFVSKKLEQLEASKAAYENLYPNGAFNLEETEAKYCFIMLRNLIRRGGGEYGSDILEPEDLLNEIKFLLSIPSVRNLAHQVVDVDEDRPGFENELLRLALRIGNREAADILLDLPEVRQAAIQNDFYEDEQNGQLNLREIAQNRESSMIALSEGECSIVKKVELHYQSIIAQKGGWQKVFDEFIELLKVQYQAEPATFKVMMEGSVEVVYKLPLEWECFQRLCAPGSGKLNLTETQYQTALKSYYQHYIHTAYRYLSKPNKWMAKNASYVCGHTEARYSYFEAYREIIALFYLASHDEKTPAIDGYTLKDRAKLFIAQLALIGRAHNWDKRRPALINGKQQYDSKGKLITEEYDDLEGDKPSCYSGVIRRIFQSVLGHGLFKQVTKSIIKQAINEQVRKYFEENITFQNCRALKEAYEGIIDGENIDKHIKVLRELDFTDAIKEQIITHTSRQLKDEYQENFEIKKSLFEKTMQEYLNSGGVMQPDIMAFNEITGLIGLVEKRCRKGAIESHKNHYVFFQNSCKQSEMTKDIHNKTLWENRNNSTESRERFDTQFALVMF